MFYLKILTQTNGETIHGIINPKEQAEIVTMNSKDLPSVPL